MDVILFLRFKKGSELIVKCVLLSCVPDYLYPLVTFSYFTDFKSEDVTIDNVNGKERANAGENEGTLYDLAKHRSIRLVPMGNIMSSH